MHHFRRRGRFRGFVRTSLRRRIFAYFASGIFTTAVLVALVMSVLARVDAPQFSPAFKSGTAWFGAQAARDWDDPVRRDAWARDAAQALNLDLELRDATGAQVLLVGSVCEHHAIDVPVVRAGVELGSMRACFRPSTPGFHWLGGIAFVLLALWMGSGRVARRLALPLDEITDVVQRIGQGDLAARTAVSCFEPDELGVVARAVNNMAGRIEKQLKDERELMATVSHELRTPLARMRVISEIARETGPSGRTWDDLDREVQDMDGLVGELLASSRVEFGLTNVRPMPLRDLVTRALERVGADPGRATYQGEGDTVEGDPTLLARALANLLENARRHAGGVDELHVTVQGKRVAFEVRDRGPGLPQGEAAVRFEKFRTGGASQGLGLGLALVRRIAEAHQGRVWAQAREGGGAAVGFEVWSG